MAMVFNHDLPRIGYKNIVEDISPIPPISPKLAN